MNKKIKDAIDFYIEFDSDKLFNNTDYLVVFGGILRDIVAGDEDKIKDIDIMCLSKSRNIATNILLSEGYIRHDLFSPDTFLLYTKIKCIFEPKTFVKGNKVVQLITPVNINANYRHDDPRIYNEMKFNFFEILQNVDLTTSGLVFDGEELFESVRNSYYHCKNKYFHEIIGTKMYNEDRITIRKNNLYNKKFKMVKNDDIKFIRSQKILSIRNTIPSINKLREKILSNEIKFQIY